jgi:DNA repair exonuclease SbcCD ATPase subunit
MLKFTKQFKKIKIYTKRLNGTNLEFKTPPRKDSDHEEEFKKMVKSSNRFGKILVVFGVGLIVSIGSLLYFDPKPDDERLKSSKEYLEKVTGWKVDKKEEQTQETEKKTFKIKLFDSELKREKEKEKENIEKIIKMNEENLEKIEESKKEILKLSKKINNLEEENKELIIERNKLLKKVEKNKKQLNLIVDKETEYQITIQELNNKINEKLSIIDNLNKNNEKILQEELGLRLNILNSEFQRDVSHIEALKEVPQ